MPAAATPQPSLHHLIPLAIVIACGCEPCAQSAVMRAVKQGTPTADVEQTLRIIAYLKTMECLIRNVGPETVARMEKPLSAAFAKLREFSAGPA
ncbi:MAG: carboxymuconolactone decarboxylase family protein [Acidobacteriia bacterium]|nr:carboxymuconolactone decarboxylase family protein [Terriglobia bacterium]